MMSSHGETGSATLELTILAPALLTLLGLAILAGRIETSSAAVEQAAAVAAREASLARSAAVAHSVASLAAQDSLASQGITCGALSVTTDSSGFSTSPGAGAIVRVTIACAVPMSDLAVPGLPGTHTVRAMMSSPLDTYRSR
jgi:Flp pilus assembly protein TadG